MYVCQCDNFRCDGRYSKNQKLSLITPFKQKNVIFNICYVFDAKTNEKVTMLTHSFYLFIENYFHKKGLFGHLNCLVNIF